VSTNSKQTRSIIQRKEVIDGDCQAFQ